MRGLVLVLILLLIAAVEAFGAGAAQIAPRVALGVDGKGGQRYVQLTARGGPVYPTADVTCDGNRRTITLARSGNVGDRVVATYAVPPKISEGMLRAAECRLMFPGREIPLARQQIRAAWSGQAKAQK
ncbi:MAG: hypothetical protein ACRELZ_08950 [Candidatus Rokuibacteriota bacterium]